MAHFLLSLMTQIELSCPSRLVSSSSLYSSSSLFSFYIVTEVCVGEKLDESNSEKACEIFSYCNSEWEMQRQGTF